MARKGRSFEELVAAIEASLVPKGAVVKSPDRLIDKISGELREVDVSIRLPVGSTNVLITLECRDRSSVQDVTWIEQVVTKRNNIGADKTVVVSSSGFSAPAIKVAEMHGIEVRLLDQVTPEEIASVSDLQSVFFGIAWEIELLQIGFAEQINDSLLTLLDARMNQDGLVHGHQIMVIAFDSSGEQPLTAARLFFDYLHSHNGFPPGWQLNDTFESQPIFSIPLDPGRFYVVAGDSKIGVASITLKVKTKREILRSPIDTATRYSSGKECILTEVTATHKDAAGREYHTRTRDPILEFLLPSGRWKLQK